MPFIDLPDRIPGLRARARSDQPWYRITNQAADEAEVMLYDEVGGWYGATADEFINDLRGITAPNILLRVNSPGGSVTEGIAIANALRSHPANITVQVDGIAASIASVIAMAGDTVRMMPNALLMVHEASGFCVGEAADMIKMAEILDKISDNIAGAYAARAGGTEADWRQVMKNETWYRGEEAVAAGLADEVVPIPERGGDGEPEMRQEYDLTAYGYQGPSQAEPPEPAAVEPDPLPTLIINVENALADEEIVKRLREMAGRAPEQTPETPPEIAEQTHRDDAKSADNTVETEPPPAVEEPPAETVPEDEWTALTAHLAEPIPDPWAATVAHLTQDDAWSALVSNLIEPDTSSSATAA